MRTRVAPDDHPCGNRVSPLDGVTEVLGPYTEKIMPLSSLGIRHSVSENAIVSGHRPAQYLLGPLILTTALLIGCGGGVAAAPKGTSSAGATLAVGANSLNFGSVSVASSKTNSLVLSNGASGGSSITVTQSNVTGTGFSLSSGPAVPFVLAPGQSATLVVSFAPTAAGSASGTLSIISDAANSTATVSLSGTALAPAPGQLAVAPATVNFGSITVGSSKSQTGTLTASSTDITVTSAASTQGYSLSGIAFPATVPANQSISFTVTFAPQTVGTSSGNISFVSNASNSPNTETLAGTGAQSGGGGGSVNRYEFVFTDGTLYIYSIDTLSSTPVKTVSLPTTAGTRGSVACVGSKAIYVSFGLDGATGGHMLAIDLTNFSIKWNKSYSHGIDSQSIAPDCSKIYMPDGESASGSGIWHVVDPSNGNDIGSITSSSFGPHNTIVHNGHVYLGGRQASVFQAARTSDNSIYFTSNSIPAPGNGGAGKGVRPFTINSEETAAYLTQTCPAPCSKPVLDVVNLTNGSVSQKALPSAACTSGSCPSTPNHGIAMSPDEQKLYVIDAINNVVYVFNIAGANLYAPQLVDTVHLMHNLGGHEAVCAYDCLGDGWLHISHDGKYLFVGDSGDVVDLSSSPPQVVAYFPQMHQTRKEIEIDCDNSIAISTGCNPVFAMNNRSSIGNP